MLDVGIKTQGLKPQPKSHERLVFHLGGGEHRLDVLFRNERDHEVIHQGHLAVGIEGHDPVGFQFSQGHFHHADGTFHDHLAGGDHSLGLLTAEHGPRDFWTVGEVAKLGFHDLDAGD
jgi:hypothetical protein